MKPLIYLELRYLLNAIKFAARRPKRLIPAFLIGLWVLMSLLQSLVFMSNPTDRRGPNLEVIHDVPVESVKTILIVLLTIGSAAMLYNAFGSGLMVFSLAQIDFLFPLPVRRRSVLVLKLVKDYVKYGLTVTLMFLVLGPMLLGWVNVPVLPWGLLSIAALTAMIILVVNVSNTINIVITFGFERLRGTMVIAKAALVAVPVLLGFYLIYRLGLSGGDPASLVAATNSILVRILLAPVSWCAELVLAPLRGVSIPEDYIMLAGLWALAGASFLLLLSRKENIYEPSLGVSSRYARRRQALRSGGQVDLLTETLREQGAGRLGSVTLRPFGRGAVAFLWKNLLVRYRLSRRQLLFMLAAPVVIIYSVKVVVKQDEFFAYLPAILLYAVWVMALSTQGDARADLRYANIAKSIPVAAWKIILAQTASYGLFVMAGALAFGVAMVMLMPQARTQFALAALAAAPFVSLSSIPAVLIPSILYPDTRDTVQNYLCGMVSMLFSWIAIMPGLVTGLVLWYLVRMPLHWTLVFTCAAFLATSAVGVAIAGVVYEKFEPTGE